MPPAASVAESPILKKGELRLIVRSFCVFVSEIIISELQTSVTAIAGAGEKNVGAKDPLSCSDRDCQKWSPFSPSY